MNKFMFSGFISTDIKGDDIKTKNGETMRKCSFNIACQRKVKGAADFPRVTAIGKNAELIEKYFTRGRGIEVTGHVQTGSYEGKNGKVYTTDHIIDEFEFPKVTKAEEQQAVQGDSSEVSPKETNNTSETTETENEPSGAPENDFMSIPDDDSILEDLPFK